MTKPHPASDEEIAKLRAVVRKVIAERRFELAFQPVVRLSDRRIHHVEALLRLDTEHLDLTPQEFFRFAEWSDIVTELDAVVVETAIKRLREVGETGKPIPISVNLSAHSIAQPEFMAKLEPMLRGRRSLISLLQFEITNSARIEDLRAVNLVIQELRQRGYKVALDDFGTGGAAFEQLRALDVDFVKIDGSYVTAAAESPKGRAFITAMANLCRDLGTATIAEQVEDEDSAAFLRGCGVDYGQGYLFGRPDPNVDLLSGRIMGGKRWRRQLDRQGAR